MTTMNETKLIELKGIQTECPPQNLTFESMPEVLTAQMIADYLHISRRRVYELFKIPPSHGGIPNYDIGISKRVDKPDFISWIEALKEKKQSKKPA